MNVPEVEICIYVWQELLIEKVILKLVYIGKKAAYEEAEHAAKFAEMLGRRLRTKYESKLLKIT